MANMCCLYRCGLLLHEKSAGLVEASSKKTVDSVNVNSSSVEFLLNNCRCPLQHHVRFLLDVSGHRVPGSFVFPPCFFFFFFPPLFHTNQKAQQQ